MADSKETLPRMQEDSAWKGILEEYFEQFCEICWPSAYQAIDWSKKYENREQELSAIGLKEEIGQMVVDKLFKVYLKDGTEQWCLCHLEVQSSKDLNFPWRMHIYDARIYDRYKKNVASIAILTDNDPNWRPNSFERKIWGSTTRREFETIKLSDIGKRLEDIKFADNPFALVLKAQRSMAEKFALHDVRRIERKVHYFRLLLSSGMTKKNIENVHKFIDLLMTLNHEEESNYISKAKELEQEYGMQVLSSTQEYFKTTGQADILAKLLTKKYGNLGDWVLNKLTHAEGEQLSKWAENFVDANNIDEVFRD